MNIKEREIAQEIKDFQEVYQGIINQIDCSYTGLAKAREQFPLSFLNKSGIEIHISKLFDKNKDKIKQSNEEIKRIKLNLVRLQKEQQEVDPENTSKYQELNDQIRREKDSIVKEQSETHLLRKMELQVTPERVTYFYEDLLLFVASCKHEALELWKFSSTVYDDIKINEEHFSGRFLVDVADDALKDKGYSKIIGDFRVAYLNSRTDLKFLRQILNRARVVRDASGKLLSAFEADEVNFRKFTERVHKLGGM